jgi:hypothetical protein
MIKVNCWNEYDNLKTVILGDVFQDLSKIPNMYKDDPAQQDAFIKIVEETTADLNNIQKVLEQHSVKVLRPSQPKNYNMAIAKYLQTHSPMINMRDFHMAYGNVFYMTYGSYQTRRFQHAWVEDIVNQMIMDDNIVISANEPNMSTEKINSEERSKEWNENYSNSNKNLFHTACILKHNKKAYIRENSGSPSGKRWMTKMLSMQGIETIEIPGYGHLDAEHTILREDVVFTSDTSLPQWQDFKYKISSVSDVNKYWERQHKLLKTEVNFKAMPLKWLTEWQGYFQEFRSLQNCLSISPGKVLLAVYDKEIFEQLIQIGIEPILVDWRHGSFWGGGLHCITCDIERN